MAEAHNVFDIDFTSVSLTCWNQRTVSATPPFIGLEGRAIH
ncbi:hypothetical protein BN8_p06869 (plasmid) [Fibrisoma limi BUZ 3]|uniref:Uncharacterized protein n=1 Tax=Fibrisoma limi BUZ 3 TaxID=1185876 RepID=I2GU61_9BACT|nr:hypothetical protein BN8_p06869 [Fibrisoma limi BUZ 3]